MTAAPRDAVAPSRSPEAALLRERRVSRGVAVLAPLVLFAVLGVVWQGVAAASPSLLPPLGHVAADLVGRPGFYAAQTWETLQSALYGLAIGVVVALLLAVGMVEVRILNAAVLPVALLVVSTPVIAILPALITAFGFGRTPHVIIVALIVFFPMLVNATRGLRQVDGQALEVLRTLSASRRDVLLRLRLPSSVPFLFAGLRLSASGAMTGAIISEFLGSTDGLGASIESASSTLLNLAQLWGSIFVSAVVTIALVALVGLLERAVVRW